MLNVQVALQEVTNLTNMPSAQLPLQASAQELTDDTALLVTSSSLRSRMRIVTGL